MTYIPATMNAPASPLLDQFSAIVGAVYALREPSAIAPYLVERREKFSGRTALVLRPGSVAEVAAIVKLANETRTGIVPQGGKTGLVGGQMPSATGDEIVVSLSRLDRVRAVDAASNTMTVEAGVILANAQAAAATAERLFRSRWPQKARARSAATSRPTPAAPRCSPTAPRASWCWGWRWCCPPARYGADSARSARTTPATT